LFSDGFKASDIVGDLTDYIPPIDSREIENYFIDLESNGTLDSDQSNEHEDEDEDEDENENKYRYRYDHWTPKHRIIHCQLNHVLTKRLQRVEIGFGFDNMTLFAFPLTAIDHLPKSNTQLTFSKRGKQKLNKSILDCADMTTYEDHYNYFSENVLTMFADNMEKKNSFIYSLNINSKHSRLSRYVRKVNEISDKNYKSDKISEIRKKNKRSKKTKGDKKNKSNKGKRKKGNKKKRG
jgi:hypothetical protein